MNCFSFPSVSLLSNFKNRIHYEIFSPNLIEGLTRDLMLEIFDKLDIKSLFSARKTCKRWYKLTDEDRIWKKYFFNFDRFQLDAQINSLPVYIVSKCKEFDRLAKEDLQKLASAFESSSLNAEDIKLYFVSKTLKFFPEQTYKEIASFKISCTKFLFSLAVKSLIHRIFNKTIPEVLKHFNLPLEMGSDLVIQYYKWEYGVILQKDFSVFSKEEKLKILNGFILSRLSQGMKHLIPIIDTLEIEDENKRFEIALLCADLEPSSTSMYIKKFHVNDESKRFLIAKKAYKSFMSGNCNIENYELKNQNYLNELGLINALYNPFEHQSERFNLSATLKIKAFCRYSGFYIGWACCSSGTN